MTKTRMILITKGNPISHAGIVTEDGKKYLWTIRSERKGVKITPLQTAVHQIKHIVGNCSELYSRSWDMKMLGEDIPFTHVKDYFIKLSGINERLSRFEMAKRIGLLIKGNDTGKPLATAKIYWVIFKKLEARNNN